MNLIGLSNIKYEIKHLSVVPHILFYGGRGTGKTSLAEYITKLKKKKLVFLTGNTLKKNELLQVFINIEEDDVILIDEIHRLSPAVEELLYHPMEKFMLPIKDNTGMYSEYKIPRFTLIGTTTKPSSISKPLMSRFQITFQVPHYSVKELAKIVKLNFSQIENREAIEIAINVIAPREAINLARRVVSLGRDIKKNLEFIGYKYGLSRSERFYLKIVHRVGKISLDNLASALQLDKDEVKYTEEKLIRKGFIQVSSKGRSLTVKGLLKIKEIAR